MHRVRRAEQRSDGRARAGLQAERARGGERARVKPASCTGQACRAPYRRPPVVAFWRAEHARGGERTCLSIARSELRAAPCPLCPGWILKAHCVGVREEIESHKRGLKIQIGLQRGYFVSTFEHATLENGSRTRLRTFCRLYLTKKFSGSSSIFLHPPSVNPCQGVGPHSIYF